MTTHPYRQGIPQEILALSHERDLLRRKGHYKQADVLKQQLEDAGYAVKDNPHGAHLVILQTFLWMEPNIIQFINCLHCLMKLMAGFNRYSGTE